MRTKLKNTTQDRQRRYGIRKLTVGTVSILLGTFLAGHGHHHVVHASALNNNIKTHMAQLAKDTGDADNSKDQVAAAEQAATPTTSTETTNTVGVSDLESASSSADTASLKESKNTNVSGETDNNSNKNTPSNSPSTASDGSSIQDTNQQSTLNSTQTITKANAQSVQTNENEEKSSEDVAKNEIAVKDEINDANMALETAIDTVISENLTKSSTKVTADELKTWIKANLKYVEANYDNYQEQIKQAQSKTDSTDQLNSYIGYLISYKEQIDKAKQDGIWNISDQKSERLIDPLTLQQGLNLGKEDDDSIEGAVTSSQKDSVIVDPSGWDFSNDDRLYKKRKFRHFVSIKNSVDENSDLFTITYTPNNSNNYEDAYYQSANGDQIPIDKIEITFSNWEKTDSWNSTFYQFTGKDGTARGITPGIYLGDNPLKGFYYYGAKSVTFDIKVYEKGSNEPIQLGHAAEDGIHTGAFLTVKSLNSSGDKDDRTENSAAGNQKYVEKVQIIQDETLTGSALSFPESSVTPHSDENDNLTILYSEKDNNGVDKGGTDTNRNGDWNGKEDKISTFNGWDGSEENEIFGAGVFSVNGNHIKVKVSNEMGSAWVNYSIDIPKIVTKDNNKDNTNNEDTKYSLYKVHYNAPYNIYYRDVTNTISSEYDENSGDIIAGGNHDILLVGRNYSGGSMPDVTNKLWDFSKDGYVLAAPLPEKLGKQNISENTPDQYVYLRKVATEVPAATKTASRTIHFKSDTGKTLAPDQVQTVTYTRDAYYVDHDGNPVNVEKDSKGNNLVISSADMPSWQATNGKSSFDEVDDPTGSVVGSTVSKDTITVSSGSLKGTWTKDRTADSKEVAAPTGDGSTWIDADDDVTLVYTKDVNADISFWDVTNGIDKKTSLHDVVYDKDDHGKANDIINFTENPQDVIDQLTKDGYALVTTPNTDTNNWTPGVKYNKDDTNNHFNVYLIHKNTVVSPSDSPEYPTNVKEENKKATKETATHTVKYFDADTLDANGKPTAISEDLAKTVTQTVTWTRYAVYDNVDGSFLGYAKLDKNDQPEKDEYGNTVVDPDLTDDNSWIITRTQDGKAIDGNTAEFDKIDSNNLTGSGYKTNRSLTTTYDANDGGASIAAKKASFGVNTEDDVYYFHDIIPVTSTSTDVPKDQDGKDVVDPTSLTKTIVRNIYYVSDGDHSQLQKSDTQKVTFTGTTYVDLVTKKEVAATDNGDGTYSLDKNNAPKIIWANSTEGSTKNVTSSDESASFASVTDPEIDNDLNSGYPVGTWILVASAKDTFDGDALKDNTAPEVSHNTGDSSSEENDYLIYAQVATPQTATKKVTRIIHFITDEAHGSKTLAPDKLQTVTYTSNYYVDSQGKEVAVKDSGQKDKDDNPIYIVDTNVKEVPARTWTSENSILPEVDNPDGFNNGIITNDVGTWTTTDKADKEDIGNDPTKWTYTTTDDKNYTAPDATLVYTKDVNAKIKYVNDTTGATLIDWTNDNQDHGKSGQDITFNDSADPAKQIKAYEDKGYVLVRNDFGSGQKYGDNDSQYEIHFVHAATPKTINKTASRNIHYVGYDGTTNDVKKMQVLQGQTSQSIELTGTYYTDAITGKMVTKKTINGKDVVDSIVDNPAVTWTINNATDDVKQSSEANKYDFAAVTGPKKIVNSSWNHETSMDQDSGELTTADVNSNDWNSDLTDAYLVYVQPAAKQTETKSTKRKIHYVEDDGSGKTLTEMPTLQDDTYQEVTFEGTYYTDEDGNRVAVKALNNGEIIVVKGKPIETWKVTSDKDIFNAVIAPSNFDTWNYKDSKNNNTVTTNPDSEDWKDTLDDVYLIYRQDKASYNVHYRDVNNINHNSEYTPTDGVAIDGHDITNIEGVIGGDTPDGSSKLWQAHTADGKGYEDLGYVLVQVDKKLAKQTITDNVQDQYVYLAHDTEKNSESHTVTRTIKYRGTRDGGKTFQSIEGLPEVIQSVTFNRTEIRDKVNNALLGYDTNNDGQVNVSVENGNKAWLVDGKVANSFTFDKVSSQNPEDINYSAVDIPEVEASTVSPNSSNPKDITVTYNYYVPSEISFYDDTDKVELPDLKVSTDRIGVIGDKINLDITDSIKKLQSQGYTLVRNDFEASDKTYHDGDNKFEVHLIHKQTEQTKTPDTVQRHRTINYYDGETGESLAAVAPSVTQTITYQRTPVKDEVTGEIIGYAKNGKLVTDPNEAWVHTGGLYTIVDSPNLTALGYKETPSFQLGKDNGDAATAPLAQADISKDAEDVNIYYFHNTREEVERKTVQRHIYYWDGTTKTRLDDAATPVTQTEEYQRTKIYDAVTGKFLGYQGRPRLHHNSFILVTDPSQARTWVPTDELASFQEVISPDLTNLGYKSEMKFADNTNAEKAAHEIISYDENGDPVDADDVNIYYFHDTEPVNESATVTHTIDFKYVNGPREGKDAGDNLAKTITYTRSGARDKVTGEIIYDKDGQWFADDNFEDITSPTHHGYHADKGFIEALVVDASTLKNGDEKHQETHVKYYAEKQKMTIDYINDDTNQILKTDEKEGYGNSESGYSTADSIKDYEGQGYILVDDTTSKLPDYANLKFDNDTAVDQHFEVHLKHAVDTNDDNPSIVYDNPSTQDDVIIAKPQDIAPLPEAPVQPENVDTDLQVEAVHDEHIDQVHQESVQKQESIKTNSSQKSATSSKKQQSKNAVVSSMEPKETTFSNSNKTVVEAKSNDVSINKKQVISNNSNSRTNNSNRTVAPFADEKLPQTSEKDSKAISVIGLAAIALGGLLGLAGTKRKKKKND